MIREKLRNIIENSTNLEISGSHFGAICMILSRGGAFFSDLLFGTFAGHPQERFWTPKWSKRVPKGAQMEPESVPKWCKITSPLIINLRKSFLLPLRHYDITFSMNLRIIDPRCRRNQNAIPILRKHITHTRTQQKIKQIIQNNPLTIDPR